MASAGRIAPAAHPQTEFTATSRVPLDSPTWGHLPRDHAGWLARLRTGSWPQVLEALTVIGHPQEPPPGYESSKALRGDPRIRVEVARLADDADRWTAAAALYVLADIERRGD